MKPLHLTPLPGLPLVKPGDDLPALLRAAAEREGVQLADGVLVVCQKVVSKAEGRVVRLAEVEPSEEARRIARSNSLGQNYEYIGRLFDKGLGRKIYKRDLEMSDADCNIDFLMEEQIIAGDVDEVLRRLMLMVLTLRHGHEKHGLALLFVKRARVFLF